jgi:aminoglycoside phosphotransferase (APT) family kinase protein
VSAAAGRRMLGLLLAGPDIEAIDVTSAADLQALAHRRMPALLLHLRPPMPLADVCAVARDALGGAGRVGLLLDNRWRLPFGGPSVASLRAALRAAGFTDLAFHAVAPSSAEPLALKPQGAWPAPACLVTARIGQPDGPSPLEQIEQGLRATLAEAGPSARCRLERIVASAKAKSLVFLRAGDARIVVRVAHDSAAQDAEAHAHGVLAELQRNPAVAPLVPIALWSGSAGGHACFAETALGGRPLAGLIGTHNRAGYAAAAAAFLDALDTALPQRKAVLFAESLLPQRMQPMLERLLPWLDDTGLQQRTRRWFDDALAGSAGRLGTEHGDFSASNLLVRADRLSGVVDWENAEPMGLPLLDAFNYLDSVQRHDAGVTLAETLPQLAAGDWPVAAERDMLQRAFERCAVDARLRPGMTLLYALRHFDAQLRFAPPDAPMRQRMRQVLERLTAQPPQLRSA